MLRALAIVLAAVSAFFVFYTIRLLAVTHLLQQTRAGGQGAYVWRHCFPPASHWLRVGRGALVETRGWTCGPGCLMCA